MVGRRAFHTAIWSNSVQVTLVLTSECNQLDLGGGIAPITEFNDLVPSNYLPLMPSVQTRMVQGEETEKIYDFDVFRFFF